jgi:hypothetical protein
MKPTKNDPRNADAVIKRKDELVALAKRAGIDYIKALKKTGDDNVIRIGVLAKLLGIDATIALNTTVPLADQRGPSQPSNRS